MSSGSHRQPAIVWGPGLSIVLRRLPHLILPPAAALALATLGLKHLELLKVHQVGRLTLAVALWLLYKVASQSLASVRRRRACQQLGPNVIEVPKVKLRWPGNIDLIPFAKEVREHGEAYFR
jgi:hypothetical protein